MFSGNQNCELEKFDERSEKCSGSLYLFINLVAIKLSYKIKNHFRC